MYAVCHRTNTLPAISFDNNIIRLARVFAPYGLVRIFAPYARGVANVFLQFSASAVPVSVDRFRYASMSVCWASYGIYTVKMPTNTNTIRLIALQAWKQSFAGPPQLSGKPSAEGHLRLLDKRPYGSAVPMVRSDHREPLGITTVQVVPDGRY